jgi:hypothetical protein
MKPLIIIIIVPFLFISCQKEPKDIKETPVIRTFKSFVFVGMIGKQPGLYKYSAANNTYSKFLESSEENVFELSYSDNHSSAFFLTAVKEGKEGIFPFIKNARLYVLPDSASKPEYVEEIGSGLQVFSRWESETVFRIVINSWDKNISTYINQKTIIFNTYGRILQEQKKTFDITTDGYPRLPEIKPDSLSPSGKFFISYNEASPDSIVLVQKKNNNEFFITRINKPVNEIAWSDDRNFLFISTLDITPANTSIFTSSPKTSSLYAYSVNEKKLVKEWAGGGDKNFFTISDFLIFDDGFGRNSSIYIYNFNKNKIIKQIKVRGGCGLRKIPEIPQFGS